jgi:hypothetical protein
MVLSWEKLLSSGNPMGGPAVHQERLSRAREEKDPRFLRKGKRGMPEKPIRLGSGGPENSEGKQRTREDDQAQ